MGDLQGNATASTDNICPVCGKGTFLQVDFGEQQPESRQVETYTCGHEIQGARLDTANPDQLNIERRSSEETVGPVDPEG